MIEIRLPGGAWRYDPTALLGPPGGFGEVFSGDGPNGRVAVKRILTAIAEEGAADREMEIGARLAGGDYQHVMPTLDWGQDAETGIFFLVMPVASKSLKDYLDASAPLPLSESRAIALAIARGLSEIPDLVHRDLKPGNILLFEGRWRIADFGIAKFVEDSTSSETLRDVMTRSYAAPEQWNGLRPVHATDVYALGCILYAMINGAPPFFGDVHSLREGHLHQIPPPLSSDVRLASFAQVMLRKPPESRPTIGRCIEIFGEVPDAKPINSAFAAAAGRVAMARSLAEAEAAEKQEAAARLQRLISDGIDGLDRAFTCLANTAAELSDDVQISDAPPGRRIGTRTLTFGEATLQMEPFRSLPFPPPINLAISTGTPMRRIIAHGFITLVQLTPRLNRPNRISATLVYASDEGGAFRWYEVAFYQPYGTSGGMHVSALQPESPDFQYALGNGMHIWATAYGPIPIDGEAEGDFIERWLNVLGKAAVGELPPIFSLPLNLSYFRN